MRASGVLHLCEIPISESTKKGCKGVKAKGRQKGFIVGLCLILGFPCVGYAATLVQTVRSTLATNPQVVALEANFRAARAAVTGARGGLFPEVTLEAGQGYEGTSNPILKASGVDHRNLLRKESSVTATQTLFDGFKVSGEIKQKKALLQSSIALLQAQRETVALQVVEAYLNVLRRKETLALAKKNVIAHKHILRQVSKRYESGLTTKVDVVLAKSRLALAVSRVVTAQGLLRDANTEYITVTGHAPKNLSLPKIPYKKVPKTFKRLREIAFGFSPTLRASDNNYVAAIEDVQIAKSAYYPEITLDVSATDSNNLDGIIGNNQDAQIMFRASYNLFRGGSDMALVAENRHKMYSAYEAQLNTRRELNKKISLAWDSLKTNRENLTQLKAHAVLSKNVVEGYWKQFVLGRRALFNVLDAENESFLSRISYINALYDVRISVYSVLESAGVLVKTLLHQWNPVSPVRLKERPHKKPETLPRKEVAKRKVTSFVQTVQLPRPNRTMQLLPQPNRSLMSSISVLKMLFETIPLPLKPYQKVQPYSSHKVVSAKRHSKQKTLHKKTPHSLFRSLMSRWHLPSPSETIVSSTSVIKMLFETIPLPLKPYQEKTRVVQHKKPSISHKKLHLQRLPGPRGTSVAYAPVIKTLIGSIVLPEKQQQHLAQQAKAKHEIRITTFHRHKHKKIVHQILQPSQPKVQLLPGPSRTPVAYAPVIKTLIGSIVLPEKKQQHLAQQTKAKHEIRITTFHRHKKTIRRVTRSSQPRRTVISHHVKQSKSRKHSTVHKPKTVAKHDKNDKKITTFHRKKSHFHQVVQSPSLKRKVHQTANRHKKSESLPNSSKSVVSLSHKGILPGPHRTVLALPNSNVEQ